MIQVDQKKKGRVKMTKISRKKVMAAALTLTLAAGMVGEPFFAMNQKQQEVVAQVKMAQSKQNLIPNKTVKNLEYVGNVLKKNQNLRMTASASGKKVKLDGKVVAFAKGSKLTIIGQKVKNEKVWYQVELTNNGTKLTGYLSNKVVKLDLKTAIKANINSNKKVKVRVGAGSKKAYLKKNGKVVALKNKKAVSITKETTVNGMKWFKITFAYKNKTMSGYIEANTAVLRAVKSKPVVTVTPSTKPNITHTPAPTADIISTPSSTAITPGGITSIPATPAVSTVPAISTTPRVSTVPAISTTPSVSTVPAITATPSVSTMPAVSVTPSVITTPAITATPGAVTTSALSLSYEDGLSQFGLTMFQQLAEEEKNNNVFMSPYSIGNALLLVDNGAKGNTKKEIESILCVNDLAKWNESAKSYLNRKQEETAVVKVSNSFWADKGLHFSKEVEEQYFKTINSFYNAERKVVDFSDKKTVDTVNQYISEKTEKMIDKMLDKTSPNWKTLIINTVYFNGEWKNQFDAGWTRKADFHNADKTTSSVDMMSKEGCNFKYIEKAGLRAVEMPYGDGDIAMDILLSSDEKESTLAAFSKLTQAEQRSFLKELSNTKETRVQQLDIPKFKMEYGVKELNNNLQKMGMLEAFSDSANFDGFNPEGEKLYIETVQHKAVIEVAEKGTKAAAVTLIGKATCAMPDKDAVHFVADRPFVFVIKDTKTGMILFVGAVNHLDESNQMK